MVKRVVKPRPKKKQTLVPEPKWERLQKAKDEDAKYKAFISASDFVHYEVPDREQLHWLKKWIREESGWDLWEETKVLPDVFMNSYSKWGWLAIRLGFMPEKVRVSFQKNLKPLLERAHEHKEKHSASEPLIHPKVQELEEDDELHPEKVKEWIKYWQDYVKANKKHDESKDWKLRHDLQTARTYVSNMSTYLRTSIWVDSRWGKLRENKTTWVCVVPAYDKDGLMKRTTGVFYPDIQAVWGIHED